MSPIFSSSPSLFTRHAWSDMHYWPVVDAISDRAGWLNQTTQLTTWIRPLTWVDGGFLSHTARMHRGLWQLAKYESNHHRSGRREAAGQYGHPGGERLIHSVPLVYS
jgi:hypothetical protein